MSTLGVLFVIALIAGVSLLLLPRRSSIAGQTLEVHSPLHTFRFDLRHALEIRPISRAQLSQGTTIRVFGIGWPFRPMGWFHNTALGSYLNVADDSTNMFLVRFPERTLIISAQGGAQELARYLH